MTSAQQVDERRVRALAEYDVLEHPPSAELLAIVELAALVCGTSKATINLITADAQHQVVAHGFDPDICRREDSMCATVLDQPTPVVVADASVDDRFRNNPFVTGAIGHVRFYASHQLLTPDGVAIGTLCVFDEQPRTLDHEQTEALGTLADRIVDVLELSLRSRMLAVSNERLSVFAGRVSHDLKAPLSTVSMSLGLLHEQLSDGADAAEVAWLLERAIGGVSRMAALIDEVLAFASFGGALRSGPVDLDHELSAVVTDLDGALGDAEILRSALPVVHGDAVQLRSLLQNVLDNAIKYRRRDRPLRIAVSAEGDGDRWRVLIADNGRGVPVDQRERVFESRVRLGDDAAGNGIGLDTCRRIAHAHGGSIALTETAGGGTTVCLELPA